MKFIISIAIYILLGTLHYLYWILLIKEQIDRPKWFLWLTFPLSFFYGIVILVCGILDRLSKK
jgi:cytochrome bd-type quinol oxidase subunit 1